MENSKLKRNVLMLYRTFGPSVNLCGYAQFEKLAKDNYIEFRHKKIIDVTGDDLKWAELAVFVRGDGLLDELMAKVCGRAGKFVLYILDDDLLNVPAELGSGPYYSQISVKGHIRKMLEYADCFASPSEKLLKRYGGLCRYSFKIIEPSLFSMEQKQEWEDGKIHIGFCGSSDRGRDIDQLISEALIRTAERYGSQISIEFFGVETEVAKRLDCKTYPYTETYEEYQQLMSKLNWDIGLAPMPDTDFHSCKHYNKLVEYCGFGIAGIYSDLLPYKGAVENGVTGLLCENTTEAWEAALSKLIEDDALRQKIAANCLDRAHSVFSVETAAGELKKEMDKLHIQGGTSGEVRGNLAAIKAVGLMSWYMEKLKKYRWKTPVVAVKKLVYLMKRGG